MQANQQIVFIDSQVTDYQLLAKGVTAGTEVVILKSDRSGISQIAEILRQKNNYASIHIVSHGSPGCLYLGNTQLSLDTLNRYTKDLEIWFSSSSFIPHPSSLLIYGCNVAAGDAGEEFMSKLHDITGASIAASTTPIGNSNLGGNWDLDIATNNIIPSLALTSEIQRNYQGVLGDDDNPLAKDLVEDTASITTDLDDYAPGSTAYITGENFEPGETVELEILHTDGTPNTGGGHEPWQVTDGGKGDLDGVVDGNFRTTWYVNPDDSLNSTFELTAAGLNSGNWATHTFTDADPAVQFFYVPFAEKDIITAFDAINGSDSGDTLDNVISITLSTNNTIVYYDHWEDGYETDLDNPIQNSTEVWGDNDPSNGIAPGFTTDVLNPGDIVTLEQDITTEGTENTRNPNSIFFDGRDKVGSSKAVVLTRQVWSTQITSFLAGAAEVLDTSKWGTNFSAPIGEDVSSDNMFDYVALAITASVNGTTINIDTDGDGNDDLTDISLDEGETYFVDGGVNSGATVTSTSVDKPIQAHLVTGQPSSDWESRWYTLFPTDQWSDTYYTPVGEVTTGTPVDIFLYNPSEDPIDITSSEATEDLTNVTPDNDTTFSIPSKGVVRRRLQDDSAVRFESDDGSDFFPVATIDAAGGRVIDWGFSLIPDTNLTPIVQLGWGLGADDQDDDGVPDKNSSPLWVTTTAPTTIYVDYDGDGVAPYTDINGGQYDESFTLGELESKQIFDTLNNDNDQTGIKVYTVDGTDIIAAWGQSSLIGVISDPSLDLGTTVLPLPVSSSWKTSTLINDDGDGLGDLGETIEYTINVQNDGVVVLGNVNVSDIIPAGTTYVPDSTSVNYIDGKINSGTVSSTLSIDDDSTGTAFALDDDDTDNGFDSGLNIGNIDSGESAQVTFQVTINDPYDGNSGFITNAANVDSDEESFSISVQTELDPSIIPTQTKSLYLSETNDLDRIDPLASNDTSVSTSIDLNALYVRDEFNSVAYDNNNGTINWSSDSNWIESNDDGLANNGTIQVTGEKLGFLQAANNALIERTVDLNNFSQATLTFDWEAVNVEEFIQVYVNDNDGSGFVFLDSYTGQGSSGSASFDVSDYISDNTGIYFYNPSGTWSQPNEAIYFDNIQIQGFDGTSTTFNQSLSMASDFEMSAGNQIAVTAYIDLTNGTIDTATPANNDFIASLSYNTGSLGTASNPTSITSLGSNVYEVNWNIALDNDVTVSSGEDISLEITNNDTEALSFNVLYDSSTYPSKIDLPTTSYINVDAIEFYNDSSANGGNEVNAATTGDTVYVRVQVSDPFGDSDITGLNLVIDDPDTAGVIDVNLDDTDLVDTSIDASGNSIKIYEYAIPLANGAELGEYTVTATATEGLETIPVTDTASTTFTVNNGTAPDVFIGNASNTEGNQLVFNVTLTDTSDTDIVLDLTTTAGTATKVADFETSNFEYSTDGGTTWISGGGTNGTQVTIPAGSSGIQVRLDSVSDTTNEVDETFTLGVNSVISGTVGSYGDTGTGTIIDDDAVPNVSIDDVSLTEGDNNTKTYTFTVTLDKTSSQTVDVDYATADGTATTANSDYVAKTGTISFAPGETSKTITVSVNGDTDVESDETFNVNLTSATNANIIDAQGIGTIVNDDSIPDVVIGDASKVEGNQLVFDVGLTSASSEDITLTLDTIGGTATDGTDYENTGFEYSTDNGVTWLPATGTNTTDVVIPAGDTSIKVRIDSNADATSESNETFTLSVDSVNSGTVGDFSDIGTGTIIDDDGTPSISIDDVSKTEGDTGTTSYTFTVSLDTASSSTVTVNYNVNDGTATTADSDYTDKSGTLTFAAGETSKTITVDITGDTAVENDETFTVDLSSATNATIGDSQGVGTVLNDDNNTGTISGTVYADIDNDDVLESPLAGVTMELLDENGNSIDSDPSTSGTQPTTTTTDSNGEYSFTDVEPGNYIVKQTNLSGYIDVSDGDSIDDGGAGGTDDDTNSNTDDNLISVSLSSQEIDTGNDFLDERTGTISGEVLSDTNNDDVGDSPLSGVTVELFEDGNATAIAITTTNSDGKYTFINVAPGDYTVVQTNLNDYGDVKDSDGTATNDSNAIAVALAAGTTSTGNDFVDERGFISGTVTDSGANALEDVTITLKDDSGDIVATTSTDINGEYSFADLPSGTYIVEETNLAGYTDVSEQDSITDDDDTDLETSGSGNDNILDVVLVAGESDTGNDFIDEAQPETIAGKVLEDTNGDGVGDTPLSGVTVTLGGAANQTTTTADDGSYSFDVSATGAGTYTISTPTISGYDYVNEADRISDSASDSDTDATNSDRTLTVTLDSLETDTGNNFVYEAQLGSISGTVYADDGDGNGNVGKNEVTLSLLNGNGNPVLDSGGNEITVITSGGGIYRFDDLEPGNYRVVEIDPNGYSSVSDGDSNDTDDDNVETNDNVLAVSLGAGETDSGNDFYDQLNGTISGAVYSDDGDRALNTNTDSGLGGVTVTLKDSDGNTVATKTTSSDGTYSFADVVPGNYTVEESDPNGYSSVLDTDSNTDPVNDDEANTADNDNSLAVTLLAGETDSGNNFLDEQNGSVSGTILADTDGDDIGNTDSPLSGVTVTLRNSSDGSTITTTTDSNGNYSFSDVAPGNYTVEETNPSDYIDVSENEGGDDNDNANNGITNSIAVTVDSGESDTGNDFVDEQTGSISGTVSEDTVGGTGIAGVTITLTNTDTSTAITTTTASDGTYSFTDLAPGNYQIDETDPGTYSSLSDEDSVDDDSGASGTDNTDNDSNSDGNNNQLTVALGAGESDTGNNFVDEIDSSIGTISGQVLEDTDGDGVGDTPIPNVLITLSGDSSQTTNTAADGTYSFSGLSDGSYTITETDPTSPTAYVSVGDTDGNNDNTIAVTLSGSSTGNDFIDGLPASISGVIWSDFDNNGVEGSFEDRVDGSASGSNLSVTLISGGIDGAIDGNNDTSVSQTIGADGSYSFTGLNPGEEYQVQFPTSATGYTGLTTQDVNSDAYDTIDSDANTLSGTTATITLAPDEDKIDVDAGLLPATVVNIDGTSNSETLSGTSGDDVIAGFKGEDTLTGGDGNDTFFYNETSDGVDIITDFVSGEDKIDLSQLLANETSYVSGNPFDGGFVSVADFPLGGAMVQIDFDGTGGNDLVKSFVLIDNLTAAGVDIDGTDSSNTDFIF